MPGLKDELTVNVKGFMSLMNRTSLQKQCFFFRIETERTGPGCSKGDHRINHYPADSVVCFLNTYPLASDLSGR